MTAPVQGRGRRRRPPALEGLEGPQTLFRLQGWYRTMLLARAVDELMWIVGAQGKAHFILTSRGHEAAQVGAAAALRPGHDYVFTYYRSMATALQLGVTAESIFLSVLAKRDDPFAGGRQLPNHFSVPRLRLPTGSSSVGTHLPHATGAGYAARVLGEDFVAVACFGDGATAKGDFHEALTIAGIWKLPVVFCCENNGLAISVPTHLETAAPIHLKGAGYGMPGVLVDGCDPLAVYEAMRAAVARARAGEGPTLIEAEVVRLVAHSNADDQSVYRSADELAGAGRATRSPACAGGSWKRARRRACWGLGGGGQAGGGAGPGGRRAGPRPCSRGSLAAPLRGVPARQGALAVALLTMLEAINLALQEEMARDERVVVLGQDVGRKGGVFGVTRGLQAQFGPAARPGHARSPRSASPGWPSARPSAGLRPVAEFQFADYLHPAFDQIANEAATISYRSNGAWRCPVVFRAPCGAGVHGGPLPLPERRGLLRPRPGPQGGRPGHPGRRPRACSRARCGTMTRWSSSSTRGATGGTGRRCPADAPLVPLGEARLDREGSTSR